MIFPAVSVYLRTRFLKNPLTALSLFVNILTR